MKKGLSCHYNDFQNYVFPKIILEEIF